MSLAMRSRRPLSLVVFAFIAAAVVECRPGPAKADASPFCPAYWQQGTSELKLFPLDGLEATIALPDAVRLLHVVWFAPDGRRIYGKAVQAPRGEPAGIAKIELSPASQGTVRGSGGLDVWSLTLSPTSSKLFVAGWAAGKGARECGYFAIDPVSGTVQTLRSEPSIDCSEGPGSIAPDGGQAVIASGKQPGLLDLETGAVRVIKGAAGAGACTWSPDGTRLACDRNGRILVVDVRTSQLREIGGSGNGRAEWSPDGRSLLVFRSQLSCLPTLYGESLAVIDVATGQRSWVRSAHCNVAGGSFYGWVDRRAVQ